MRAARALRRGDASTPSGATRRARRRARSPSSPARYPEAADALPRARARAAARLRRRRDGSAIVDRVFTGRPLPPAPRLPAALGDARRRTARAGSPYEATLLLERWFRRDGGFRYEEQPPQGAGPPLVDFVQRTRAGYCQHYAGAMALMLRMIGIPARVAVGFTAGTLEERGLDRHRPPGARLGRGVVRRTRLARVRPDAGPRHPLGRLHARLRLGRRGGGARHRALPRLQSERPPFEAGDSAPAAAGGGGEPGRPWWRRRSPGASRSSRRWPPPRFRSSSASAAPAGSGGAIRARSPPASARSSISALVDRGAAVAPGATTAELRATSERALALPAGALLDVLAEARFGPAARRRRAATAARRELRRLLASARSQRKPRRSRPRGALAQLVAARLDVSGTIEGG